MARSGKQESKREARSEATMPLATAWIGVIGAIVGALFGFLGSFLLYLQADNSQDVAADNRIADIRREAYSEFVAQTQSVRGAFVTFYNETIDDVQDKDLLDLNDKIIAPEIVEYARAASSVELVAPLNVAKASRQVSLARDGLTALTLKAISSSKEPGGSAAAINRNQFSATMAKFDRTVREFMKEARADVI